MSREEQIIEASRNPIFKTGLIRLDDISFIAGAQWADRTMLQEVLGWLKKNTYSIYDRKEHCDFGINFESEEQMLKSFKEYFNISE